mgnify:CR=1 FL=1
MPEQLDTEFFNASPGILERREALQAGIEHTNCKHCWSSYRKSGGAYRDVYNTGKIKPIKFVEVKLDNLSDMTCQYCDARSSHSIGKKQGIKQPVFQADKQDYDIFLDWLQTINEPYTLSFLGGEVTYSKNFQRFAERMLQTLQHQEMFIAIMTNANSQAPQLARFFDLIERVHKKYNLATLIVSHNLNMVMAKTTKVYCINKHICCAGKPEVIKNDPKFTEIFGKKFKNLEKWPPLGTLKFI